MDLALTPEEQAFRDAARRFLELHVPKHPLPSGDTAEGFALHKQWEKRLFEAGYAAVSWPKKYGGREASLVEWLLFEEEYYRAGAPQRIAQNGIFLLAPTIFEVGTEEQRDRILPRMASSQDVWAQGWSEPNAGSDLAGVTSRAVQVEGGFRLTGQKSWCTRGAFCDAMFGLFRTDPTAERHRGLTYLLVRLDAPGVTVRPVGRLDGDAGFADVFLDDVFVPDADVLGAVNDGWNVAMATTGSERGLTLRSPGRFQATARKLADLYQRLAPTLSIADDAAVRDGIAEAFIDAEAYQLYTLQTVTRVVDGEQLGPESSMNKLFWSEMDVRMHQVAMRMLGPLAELAPEAPAAVDHGAWAKGFMFALAGPIYAGTNEIQKNVVAERVLGLPRR
jgi:alkylation response protein AidB-like acyl-CoA dehydrogenase